MKKESLIKKYNIPVPRYTSYPTVPFWDNRAPAEKKWLSVVKKTFDETNNSKGISIYIHLPYCEKLCTYCACMRTVTQDHSVEKSYVKALLDEWKIYLQVFGKKPVLKELHLGGGTPTFFNPENLHKLLSKILKSVIIHPEHEFSFEGHPNNTTKAHLQSLFNLGFRRVSFGVQDFDPKVQETVNRIESFEKVKEVMDTARQMGYLSVNCDLIYGLPRQKRSSVQLTFELINKLKPDRIAFYSFAYVPWKSKNQQIFKDEDIPDDAEKRALYELGKEKLQKLGYKDIGMDHFALPHDELYKASIENRLHRNFMGYNTSSTDLLVGLGVSSITDAKYGYAQNSKHITAYKTSVDKGKLNHINGYFLTKEDLTLKYAILDIACHRNLVFSKQIKQSMPGNVIEKLNTMQQEGLVEIGEKSFWITDFGMVFLRNICSLFDKKLYEAELTNKTFSKSI